MTTGSTESPLVPISQSERSEKKTLWDYLELERRIEDRLHDLKKVPIEKHDFNPLRKHKER